MMMLRDFSGAAVLLLGIAVDDDANGSFFVVDSDERSFRPTRCFSAQSKCKYRDGFSARFHPVLHPWQTSVRVVNFEYLFLHMS